MKSIKILDAGCGNGKLSAYLLRYFAEYWPDMTVDLYGFDVSDHGVQREGYFDETIRTLEAVDPGTKWTERFSVLRSNDEWGFNINYFDFIVSNQVLEHVLDKRQFFRNIYRYLKTGGYSFHLNPLRHCIPEGHLWIPFVHRIRSYDLLYAYIRFCSMLGIGKYRYAKKEANTSLDEYCRRHADYMLFWTAYSSQSETLSHAIDAGLRSDFSFTWEFYYLKLCQLVRTEYPSTYRVTQSALVKFLAIRMCRYVSSVTLTLRKMNEY